MRHAVYGRKLGRNTNSRKALLKSLSSNLVINGVITTTLIKAKWVRPHVEKLVKNSQGAKLGTKRDLAGFLTKQAFLRLIGEIGPGFKARSGGYTRIIKLRPRLGDSAPMAKIEFLTWEKAETKQVQDKEKNEKH